MDNKYLTVSALNKYLYYKFDNDLNLRCVYLKAEISNVRLSKGILYFVLKDNESEIDGLMFNNVLSKLKFEPKDGMTVLVSGKVALYVKRGTYAITVMSMENVGLGEAYLKFEFLKEKLLKEGLFDESKKLPIPRFSKKIGVITSSTGDAMHDIFSTIQKRFPLTEIVFYPAIVQGEDAPKSLINAINRANCDKQVDVLIIARGGGTIEDLSCFNDEGLARTIFSSSIPTISGVGHEADFTICDFVSSRRAPTPTGAAVIATPDKIDLLKQINILQNRLLYNYKQVLISKFNEYNNIVSSYGFKNFGNKFDELESKLSFLMKHLLLLSPNQKLNDYNDKLHKDVIDLNKNYNLFLSTKEEHINSIINKLILLNPLNVMKKGYSITFKNDTVITSVEEIHIGDTINIRLSDGILDTKIINKRNIK
ncbi:MAG: exodeoxyribonuclease VII large subunit [Acholeplasmataceae bacterium]|nr:exodeoxyribonuclease VII large subunit [Acholeplasmataceae bacterium]